MIKLTVSFHVLTQALPNLPSFHVLTQALPDLHEDLGAD